MKLIGIRYRAGNHGIEHAPASPRAYLSVSIRICAVWLILAVFPQPATCEISTAENYANRLLQAEGLADELIDEERPPVEVVNSMNIIKQLLPAREDVEMAGGVIRVDNRWLHASVDQVIKYANGDLEQRRSMLIEIADRLYILQDRLNAAVKKNARDFAGQREALQKILARPEYRSDAEKESFLVSWARKVWERLLNMLRGIGPTRKQETGIENSRALTGFRILIGAVILAGLLYGAYRLIRLIGARRSREDKKAREVLGEILPDETSPADLLADAGKLAGSGDHRTAIRRAYIATLCELELRGKLRLDRSRTNRDYLNLLRGEGEILPAFTSMTGTYEEVWYGQKGATPEDFEGFLSLYHSAVGGAGR